MKYTEKAYLALVTSYLLNEPLVTLFTLFPIILAKYVGASPFQIALFTMLKPTVSFITFYWNMRRRGQDNRLQLALTSLFSVSLFLVVPFFESVWLYIAAAACYLIFSRAGMPFLMQVLKGNFQARPMQKLFSIASALNYALSVPIGLVLGSMLDHHPTLWKWLFFGTSVLVLGSCGIQRNFPVHTEVPALPTTQSFRESIRQAYDLLRRRKDFAAFQWGFMIAMVGLMLAMPAIPFFLTDIGLSFVDLMVAFTIAKGIGFVLATPLWNKRLSALTVYEVSWLVCVGFSLFYCLMLGALWEKRLLVCAYFLYGAVQSGSNLLWNLSGPLFSGVEDSIPFSSVTILMVGLRGLIVPPLGALLCQLFGPVMPIALGMIICFCGGLYLVTIQTKKQIHIVNDELVS